MNLAAERLHHPSSSRGRFSALQCKRLPEQAAIGSWRMGQLPPVSHTIINSEHALQEALQDSLHLLTDRGETDHRERDMMEHVRGKRGHMKAAGCRSMARNAASSLASGACQGSPQGAEWPAGAP